jgi:hypothetical protein
MDWVSLLENFATQRYGIVDVDDLNRGDFDLLYNDWRLASTDLAIEEMYGDKPKIDWITEGF